MAESILVVDSENAIADLLRTQSHNGSLDVSACHDAPECLRFLFEARPQLVVIDLGGARPEGVELCRLIRQMCDIPILCLTSPDWDQAIIDCLEAGADDCVTKPVSGAELYARALALLRRSGGTAVSGRYVFVGDICINADAHRVTKRDVPVPLSPREFKLLSALAERPGCVVSHEQLLSRVWGPEFVNDTHYLRLYMGYLRQKLEDDPRKPLYILNEWGVGYRLGPDHIAAMPASPPYPLPGGHLQRGVLPMAAGR
jgi:two-component system KDP operon response regulator KdpE